MGAAHRSEKQTENAIGGTKLGPRQKKQFWPFSEYVSQSKLFIDQECYWNLFRVFEGTC